jgi:hypothetical protein
MYKASTTDVPDDEIHRFITAAEAHWRSSDSLIDRRDDYWIVIYPYRDHYELHITYVPVAHEVDLFGLLRECI